MTGSHPWCCSVADRLKDSCDCWSAACECSCLKTVGNEQCPIFSEMGIFLKQPDFKNKLRTCLLSTTTEKSHMMQPIYRTHESGKGGFNYAAVSMTTSSIKWPSIRALCSSPPWSCSPLEQLLQDKSPAVPQCVLYSSAITGEKKPKPNDCPYTERGWRRLVLLPLQLLSPALMTNSSRCCWSSQGEALFSAWVCWSLGQGRRDSHLLLIFASWDEHEFGLWEYIINMHSFLLSGKTGALLTEWQAAFNNCLLNPKRLWVLRWHFRVIGEEEEDIKVLSKWRNCSVFSETMWMAKH